MASKINEKKIQEADEFMKQGDKLTTKSLLRWRADWENAYPLYEKAATNYKNAKAYTKAKDAFIKVSVAYQNMDIPHSAAKNMEEAALMAKEDKSTEEAASLFKKASDLYREKGNPDKAAETIVKAAKCLEEMGKTEDAIEYAKEACDILETDDRQQFASPTYKYATALVIQAGRLDEALEFLQRQAAAHEKLEQIHDANKMYLSIVVVHLARDDFVAANKSYGDAMMTHGFGSTAEGRIAAELLDAYESGANDNLKAIISKQVFTFLDGPIVKLAKAIKIGEGLNDGVDVGIQKKPEPVKANNDNNEVKPKPRPRVSLGIDDEEKKPQKPIPKNYDDARSELLGPSAKPAPSSASSTGGTIMRQSGSAPRKRITTIEEDERTERNQGTKEPSKESTEKSASKKANPDDDSSRNELFAPAKKSDSNKSASPATAPKNKKVEQDEDSTRNELFAPSAKSKKSVEQDEDSTRNELFAPSAKSKASASPASTPKNKKVEQDEESSRNELFAPSPKAKPKSENHEESETPKTKKKPKGFETQEEYDQARNDLFDDDKWSFLDNKAKPKTEQEEPKKPEPEPTKEAPSNSNNDEPEEEEHHEEEDPDDLA